MKNQSKTLTYELGRASMFGYHMTACGFIVQAFKQTVTDKRITN